MEEKTFNIKLYLKFIRFLKINNYWIKWIYSVNHYPSHDFPVKIFLERFSLKHSRYTDLTNYAPFAWDSSNAKAFNYTNLWANEVYKKWKDVLLKTNKKNE